MGPGERGAVRPKISAALADPEQRHELRIAKEWGYRLDSWRALSDEDRDLLLAYEALVCSRCGNLTSVCSDPNVEWHPDTTTCWASASVEWGWRRLKKLHPAEEEVTGALHPLDGVRVYAAQTPPEVDEFA